VITEDAMEIASLLIHKNCIVYNDAWKSSMLEEKRQKY
jgi:hypothetical protein